MHVIRSFQSPEAKGGGEINLITKLSSSCNPYGHVSSAEKTKMCFME